MTDPILNRQWILSSRPDGEVGEQHFEYRETPLPQPDLGSGQVLVRNLWFSFDPAMRTWLDPIPTYFPPVDIGSPMRAAALSQIVASENEQLPVGATVQGMFEWADYSIADPLALSAPAVIPDSVIEQIPPDQLLGALGGTGITAWVGMDCIGKPQKGETVVVSSAAGATGSVAAQIARIRGSRVIGIAGGKEKCRWLTDECQLQHSIDYRNQDVRQQLSELAPDGVQLFFDNVGGDILDAVLDNMAQHGRIILCGQISGYNGQQQGPANIMQVVFRSLVVQGFVMMHYLEYMDEAREQLAKWLAEGQLAQRSDIQHGFDNLPRTLLRLFRGENMGKQLLEL